MKNLLLQIITVFIVAASIYLLFSPYMAGEKGEKEKKGEADITELINYLEKSKEFYSKSLFVVHEDYQKLPNNITYNSTLSINKKSTQEYEIQLKRKFISWDIIRKDNNSIVCFSFGYDVRCANASNSSLENDFNSISTSLLTDKWVENLFINKYEALNKYGAIKEVKTTNTKKGKYECKNFELIYSYKDLTVPQLRTLGVDPNSFIVFLPEIKDDVCIGEDGKIVYKSTSFLYKGEEVKEHFLLLDYTSPKEIKTRETIKPSKVEELKSIANKFFGEYRACEGDDKCLRGVAIRYAMPSLCEVAQNYTACIDAYAAFSKTDVGCPYFVEKNLPLPPVCKGELNTTTNETSNQSLNVNISVNNSNSSEEG